MNHCSYVYITIRHKKVNPVFYIFEALEKTVARSWGKDKQTLSSRRYLARVLSSLMYRYGLRPKRKRVCGS